MVLYSELQDIFMKNSSSNIQIKVFEEVKYVWMNMVFDI